ncbi:MAG: DAK2 domain-containing protein [Erysipelotrichales bacterium]|nr:DAK2 domain-containing protein [Erysipelotrichales bacterium]
MKTINGAKMKQMIISGTNNLYNHYPEIDALNVFPVPDGDTGTNMNLTMASGAKEIQNRNDEDVYSIAKAFSRGLLMGARGNSGVILSQIFRGFAQALDGKSTIDVKELSDAFINGKDVAYKAVMRPVEGTILTVIRESATALHDNLSNVNSIEKAFEVLINEAHASLERTPELLPVLKQVGVVDSGAAGLIKILEGFQAAIKGKMIEKETASAFEDNKPEMAGANVDGDEFGYCTEFIMRLAKEEDAKRHFEESRFSRWLSIHGNSLVVVRDEDLVKVHVHTLRPGEILNFAQQFGEFVKLKIENMTEQHTKLTEEKQEENIPVEQKEYAIIAVAVGDGIEKMFKELRVDYIVSGGQTMNPATEDFVKVIKECNAKNIYILPNNSNIILAASQAAEVCEDVNVKVIPSKSIPQGLVACMMFNPEATVDENYAEMCEALGNVITGQVTFSIKDTVIDDVEIKKDQFMGMKNNKEIICCRDDKFVAAKELIESMLDEMSSIVTIIYGEDVNDEEANAFADKIMAEHEDLDIDLKKGNQPVYSFIIGVE